MKLGGFLANIMGLLSRTLGRVTPTGIGPRLFLAGALLILAVAVATAELGRAWVAVAWTLCAAAILLLIGLQQAIKARFDKVSDSLESIGLGELSGRVDTILEGESGRVVETVVRMNQDLVVIVGHVRASSDRIGVAAKEIAEGSSDLSQRTEEQASTLEEIASAMEELLTTIKQNSDNSQRASELTSESASLAAAGADRVRSAVESMSLVENSSRQIGEISKLIEGIALQTNILALNAAVEAARAGEQGRGFAVVAGEVRALARRCSDAAQDIKKLIESSVSHMTGSVGRVNDAGKVIDRLSASVHQAADLIGEIASASRDQSSGVEQVSHSIMQLENVNLQNAALVEQTHAASRLFEEEVDKLQEVVGHFKLDRAEGRHTCVALVRQGVAHVKSVGKRQACDDFDDSSGDYIFGEYYISAFDINGIRLANGLDPATRGENIFDLRDVDGKQHVRAIIAKAKSRGKGWEDYKWTSPVTRLIEQKSVYFELVDDVVVTCGLYKSADAGRSAAAGSVKGAIEERHREARPKGETKRRNTKHVLHTPPQVQALKKS